MRNVKTDTRTALIYRRVFRRFLYVYTRTYMHSSMTRCIFLPLINSFCIWYFLAYVRMRVHFAMLSGHLFDTRAAI